MELNTADVLIIITILISTVIGVYRGFVRELLTLLTLIIAASMAYIYGKTFGQFFMFVESTAVRQVVGFCAVFLIVMFLGLILKFVMCRITKLPVVSAIDRLFGGVFGLVRGCVIMVLLLLIPVKDLGARDWYKNSVLLPKFAYAADITAKSTPHCWKEDIQREVTAILTATQKPAPVTSINPTIPAKVDTAVTIKIEESQNPLPKNGSED